MAGTKRYSFRPGTRVQGVTPENAAAELERIRDAGPLTPAAVVAAASDPQNPLHPTFEWDDAEAANEHRLAQARQLIRAVFVQEDKKPAAPCFVHITFEERQYERTSVVVRSQSLLDDALNQLREKLRAAQKSVTMLIDAARIENDPDALAKAGAVEKHIEDAAKAAEGATPEPPQV